MEADVPLTERATVTGSGCTPTGRTQVVGSGHTAVGSGFGSSERTFHILEVPHLLGADVPPPEGPR